jgi:hypothetical protein
MAPTLARTRAGATLLATLLAITALLIPLSHCWLGVTLRVTAAAVASPSHDTHHHAGAGGHDQPDSPAPTPFNRQNCPLCQGRIGIAILPAPAAVLPPRASHVIVWRMAAPAEPDLRPLLRPSLPRAPPTPA